MKKYIVKSLRKLIFDIYTFLGKYCIYYFKTDLALSIENLKHNKMLDPLGQAGQAWQNGSVLAAQTPGRAAVNKQRLCGSLLTVE